MEFVPCKCKFRAARRTEKKAMKTSEAMLYRIDGVTKEGRGVSKMAQTYKAEKSILLFRCAQAKIIQEMSK
jgi:hypothetical protein